MANVEVKWTPGPWQSQHNFDATGICSIVANVDCDDGHYTYTRVCEVEDGDDYAANARLIASAPDLLKALRGFVELVDEREREIGSISAEMDDCRADARAAIAKATGAAQ